MTTINKSIYLAAPKEKVWAFLTEIEQVKIWFHRYDVKLTEGAAFKIYGQDSGDQLGFGRVLKADPHDLLEYSFAVGPMPEDNSTVTWTLQDAPGGTKLTLVHSGLPDDLEGFSLLMALDKGWDDHMGRMRDPIAA